ncbi:MAG: TerC family protein [Planctomycetota bacterium]
MKSIFNFSQSIVFALLITFSICVVANVAMAVTGTLPVKPTSSSEPNNAVPGVVDDGESSTEDGEGQGDRRIDEYYDPGLAGNLATLAMLILLQAVLGFDNLLYISLESKNAPLDQQSSVRSWGIGLAIFLRIALLGVLVGSKKFFEETNLFSLDSSWLGVKLNLHSLITLVGGAFIIYTAMKEIWHMTRLEHDDHGGTKRKQKSFGMVIFWIVLMNLVFSFDSILSAMALSDVFWVMAAAIVISGLMMIYLADRVSEFLAKNRMYEVLGLFVLFIVGIMLVSEGGHLAHLAFFGYEVTPMSKATFYFVLGVLVLVDIVQGQYQKKLLAQKEIEGAVPH